MSTGNLRNKDVIEIQWVKRDQREYSMPRHSITKRRLRTKKEQGISDKPHNRHLIDYLTGDTEKEVESAHDCFFAQDTENLVIQAGAARASSTNIFSTVSTPAKASSTNLVNTVSTPVSTASPHEGLTLSDPTNPEQDDSEIPPLEDIYQNSFLMVFFTLYLDDEGAVADFINLETVMNVSPIPTSRIISSHPSALILGDPTSAVQTRSKNEPKKIFLEALEVECWVDAMQDELLQV
ncbi:hypothetical protein Tco_1303919 [Tanacetum coccineum]